jgi:hypothetical protein
MSNGERYAPGAAFGVEVRKDGEKWTLVLVRDLRQPPATVWKALTDPDGWQRLNVEYAKQFGVETPAWGPKEAHKS